MSRSEFLQRLRDALTGQVPGNVIEENIRYYDEYIRSEGTGGQTEEVVISAIGDPRLIARTIMDVSENVGEESQGHSPFGGYQEQGRSVYEEDGEPSRGFRFTNRGKWYWKLLGVAVTVIFLFVIIGIVTGLVSLLIPLIGPLLLIFLVVWLIRGPRR